MLGIGLLVLLVPAVWFGVREAPPTPARSRPTGHDAPPPADTRVREALRIAPENEYARHGLVEALKARHLVYRMMLAYFLWMARLSSKARWAVVIGALVLFNYTSAKASE